MKHGRIEIVSVTAGEIVTLDELKSFMGLEGTTVDDTLLTAMEVSARDKCESFLRRPLLPQTSRVWWDTGIYGTISLPFGKLTSVSNITVYAEDGTPTVTDPSLYIVDLVNDQGGRVSLTQSQYGQRQVNNVAIEFVTGYADVASIPQIIKDGIKSCVSYWYENREMYGSGALTNGTRNKWNPHRIVRL
jgi:uncharacterized phiE125 gp8 family phage protein